MDKCERGNKIAPIQHACLASLSSCANIMQFYFPSLTYPAIPYCTIFPFLEQCGYVLVLMAFFAIDVSIYLLKVDKARCITVLMNLPKSAILRDMEQFPD